MHISLMHTVAVPLVEKRLVNKAIAADVVRVHELAQDNSLRFREKRHVPFVQRGEAAVRHLVHTAVAAVPSAPVKFLAEGGIEERQRKRLVLKNERKRVTRTAHGRQRQMSAPEKTEGPPADGHGGRPALRAAARDQHPVGIDAARTVGDEVSRSQIDEISDDVHGVFPLGRNGRSRPKAAPVLRRLQAELGQDLRIHDVGEAVVFEIIDDVLTSGGDHAGLVFVGGSTHVGGNDHVGEGEEFRIDVGFGFEHVEAGTGEMAGLQAADEGFFVDDLAAALVEDVGVLLHHRYCHVWHVLRGWMLRVWHCLVFPIVRARLFECKQCDR